MMNSFQFDPRSPVFRANPYPFYDMLRQHMPLFYWPDRQMWFVSRYEDCYALLRDNRLGHGVFVDAETSPLWKMQSNWMLFKNPPDHTRLRRLVHKAFTPRRVAQMRQTVQEITDRLLDQVQAAGEMDLIATLAEPLPVTVIAEMLGVPAEDHDSFAQWSNALGRSLDLTDKVEVYEEAEEAAVHFSAYLEGLIAQRRRTPQDDLLSQLVAVEEAGDQLSKEELIATCALLLSAGHETTTNLIGNGMLALLQDPAQLQQLKENPPLISSAIEELLRYDSPVQMTSRMVLEDMAYKGSTFRRGEQVNILFAAANRDPEQFPEPNQLDISRSPNRHLSFGNGIHYCIGAPLARLEGEIAFTTLLRRMPNLALASNNLTYVDNYLLRGLATLPVTF